MYLRAFLLLFVYFSMVFASVAFAGTPDIEMAVMQEDFQKVEDLSLKLLDQAPSPDVENQANYYLGLSQLRLQEYVRAEDVFLRLINVRPSKSLQEKSYLGIFDAQYFQGNYQAALKTINKLLKVSAKSESLSLIYLKAARVNLKLARWAQARDYLKKIITLFPQSMEYHIAKQLLEEKQYFAVQIGAFLERDRAQQLVEELRVRNEYAYIVETKDREGRQFYRVRVGQLSVLGEAQVLKTKLQGLGYPTRIYP